jgi:hypothetical protein
LNNKGQCLLANLKEHCEYYLENKSMKPKITKKEYMWYLLSGKQVFIMCRPVRWNRFVDVVDNKTLFNPYYFEKISRSLRTRKWSNVLRGTSLLLNRQYTKSRERRNRERLLVFLRNNPDYDPIWYFTCNDKKVQKKDLISWLNNNGDPRKLTNKTKKELWGMIMKLK